MSITVTLTHSQILLGANVGLMRQAMNLDVKRKGKYGADKDKNDWQKHIEGALGEVAAASWLEFFWDGKLGDLSPGDVRKVEARQTPLSTNRLVIHPRDGDDSRFIHVTGYNGTYELVGWITGKDGKLECYWSNPAGGNRPAFFVDNNHLEPMDTFFDDWED